jgi:hypothetical protein
LYQNAFFGEKIRQNNLKPFSAFCLNAVFGNMSCSPSIPVNVVVCLL